MPVKVTSLKLMGEGMALGAAEIDILITKALITKGREHKRSGGRGEGDYLAMIVLDI
jgi:hypothetical protein